MVSHRRPSLCFNTTAFADPDSKVPLQHILVNSHSSSGAAAPATYFPLLNMPSQGLSWLPAWSLLWTEVRGSAHLLSLGEGKTLEHIFLLLVSLSKGALTFYPLLATSFH